MSVATKAIGALLVPLVLWKAKGDYDIQGPLLEGAIKDDFVRLETDKLAVPLDSAHPDEWISNIVQFFRNGDLELKQQLLPVKRTIGLVVNTLGNNLLEFSAAFGLNYFANKDIIDPQFGKAAKWLKAQPPIPWEKILSPVFGKWESTHAVGEVAESCQFPKKVISTRLVKNGLLQKGFNLVAGGAGSLCRKSPWGAAALALVTTLFVGKIVNFESDQARFVDSIGSDF